MGNDKKEDKGILDKPKTLNYPYIPVEWVQLEKRLEGSVSEAYLVKNEKTGEKLIRLANRVRKHDGDDSFQTNFNIYSDETLLKIVDFASKYYEFLGWDKSILTDADLASQSEAIAAERERRDRSIVLLKQKLVDEERYRNNLIKNMEEKHKNELEEAKKDTNRLKQMESDLDGLINLISNFNKEHKKEEDIQKFLDGKGWLFGTTVISAKGKQRAGATDIFDFIITFTDGTQRIVELKRPDVDLIDGDGQLTAAVTKGLDQLIRYLDQTVAIAHTGLSESEYITEKKPKGILFIGQNTEQLTIEKIRAWNYALHLVEIKTYGQMINDANTVITQYKENSREIQATK